MTRTQYTPSAPPSSTLLIRRIIAVPVIVLLFSAATPFTPMAWLVGGLNGASLVDRFVAGIVLLSACYFQWAIAGLSYPVAVVLPNIVGFLRGANTATINNGRLGGRASAGEVVAHYQPSRYWMYVGAEVLVLLVAQFGPFEIARRIIVAGIVAGLWGVGWTITDRRTKMWAWGHIKAFWFFIVLDLVRDTGFAGGGSGRRRRRW